MVQILFLVFYNVDGYIEESNGEKHLVFCFCKPEQKSIYAELWDEIKNQIKTIKMIKLLNIKKIS